MQKQQSFNDKMIYVAAAQNERRIPKDNCDLNNSLGHWVRISTWANCRALLHDISSRFQSSKGSHALLQYFGIRAKTKQGLAPPKNQIKFSNAGCTHLDTRVCRQVVERAVRWVPSLLHPYVAGGG